MISRLRTSKIALTGLVVFGIATMCQGGPGQRPFPGGQGQKNPGRVNNRTPNGRIDRKADAKLANNRQVRMRQQMMREIGISQDQQMRIREILRSHEDARIASNRRLREARHALDQAVMRAQFDETLIQRRVEDLAAAQVNHTKLQSRIRTEVRKVLTAEQVNKFNQLEDEMRNRIREQKRQEMQDQPSARPPQELEFDLTRLLWPDEA